MESWQQIGEELKTLEFGGKNHLNTDAILLFGKGLYNIDYCM